MLSASLNELFSSFLPSSEEILVHYISFEAVYVQVLQNVLLGNKMSLFMVSHYLIYLC